MNAYSEERPPRSVLVMDNARIHCSEELQEMCNEAGVLLVYLPPYSPDYNPIEQSFNQIK
jgi:transposase